MAVILGIDAAWTPKQPSGVALLNTNHSGAMCMVATPSYSSFLAALNGSAVNWEEHHAGDEAPVDELLTASEDFAGQSVDIIAIDMPISKVAITERREADQAVSREFGGRWCAAHTPNANRPGPLGARLTETFLSHGYPVATTETAAGSPRHLLEVYPHPALLALLVREKRVPYKVAKARKYWPGTTVKERSALLLSEMHEIEAALTGELGPLPFTLPNGDQPVATHVLKAYEDTLDAVVSAWVGYLYLQGRAVPLGDNSAAVWCPASALSVK